MFTDGPAEVVFEGGSCASGRPSSQEGSLAETKETAHISAVRIPKKAQMPASSTKLVLAPKRNSPAPAKKKTVTVKAVKPWILSI